MAIRKEHVIQDKMSYEEYTALCEKDIDNKYEFVNGAVCTLSRGSNEHTRLGGILVSLLNTVIDGETCIASQWSSISLVDEYNNIEIEYIPDVVVDCENSEGELLPMLVIEILSKGSFKRDFVDKVSVYKEIGVMEYLIINIEEEAIFQYNQPNWELKGYSIGDIFQSGLYSNFKFDVDKFFSLDKMYILGLMSEAIANNILSK